MAARSFLAFTLLFPLVHAQSTAVPYGQCGGIGYSGPTSCGSPYTCTSYNPYYYQCYPGGFPGTPTTSFTPSSTFIFGQGTTTADQHGVTTSSATVTRTSFSGDAGTVPTTLLPGWYWIRAVESPYFHSYLQTLPTGTPGFAVMTSYTSAGQFNIVDGQLIYNTGGISRLYMNVEDPADKTQRVLKTWFNETQNAYGSFTFSGDTVTWTDPDVARPNAAAFYVCGEDDLYINTGAYLYQTPSGCWDVDIHYYGGSTANL
ncbi:4-O-methyl-glucuronoyl methylesterase [Pleurostoma richardsiae]|uniref:4-O-methyl-glucuronoyl methylesterase n=1 Tax=Pleurostoma richardsiae TaxID=41990 RepID=A0AA38R5A9_9PEZI|nr:4-O-methyl-glucuronoyl methylesterase [Pleurostoma richardsiae]